MALFAIAGDWHGQLGWAIACLRRAKEAGASIVLQCGDFGAEWPGSHRSRMADRLNQEAVQLGLPVAFIRGNHDNLDVFNALPVEPEGYAKLREMIWFIPDGNAFLWEGEYVGGLGGATSTDSEWRLSLEWIKQKPRTVYWPEEIVSRAAAQRLGFHGPVDILLTHDFPAGPWEVEFATRQLEPRIMQSARMDREIIADVRRRVSPRLHAFGHWHERKSLDSGQRGKLLEGLGRDSDREGNLILWDSETEKITELEVKYGPKKK